MPKKKTDNRPNQPMLIVRVPHEMLERLDRFCTAQEFKPPRTEIVRAAIADFLDRLEEREKPQKPA